MPQAARVEPFRCQVAAQGQHAMSRVRVVTTRITLQDLPPRTRTLSDQESSTLFGGCAGSCYPCTNDKDCCPGYSCRLGTRENCTNMPIAGPNSEANVCLYG